MDFQEKSTIKWPRIIGLLVVIVGIGLLFFFREKLTNSKTIKQLTTAKSTENPSESTSGIPRDSIINVAVVTWPGYAGGEYFNEGFLANKQSRFYKDYGFYVEFKLIDDVPASRDAFKSGDVDVLWGTMDALTCETEGFAQLKPKVIFNADWSRGGDALVVTGDINKISDLRGKTIAFAEMSPSHTLFLKLLKAAQLKQSDVTVIAVNSAIIAAQLFRDGKCDAAVVWSPDDADCVAKVKRSKVLFSTATATNIIPDVFFVKEKYLQANKERLQGLVEGWLIGNGEINTSKKAKDRAIEIMVEGLNQPDDFCRSGLDKVRLCTYGDNVNFFNINGNFNGVTGEDVYNTMLNEYARAISQVTKTSYVNPDNTPSYREIIYTGFINKIKLSGDMHLAEGNVKFSAPTEEMKTSPALTTMKTPIQFDVNSFTLDEQAKRTIDRNFGDVTQSFRNARIRIAGNTDNTGDPAMNKKLSYKRAMAVAKYLVEEYGYDMNRFVVIGNGQNDPLNEFDPNSQEGRDANRRTDFEIINQ